MNLTIGYSPCPNDCFIFDALVHRKIDTRGINFEVHLGDVETLNRAALNGDLDITKLSFHAYAYAINNYILLRAGSALGFNCGPLLVQKKNNNLLSKPVSQWRVAIPGKLTTANFLFSLAYPGATNKVEYVFSGIENAVLNNEVDAGLIIHENRFTYQDKGLEKIADMGEFWDSLINAPIPLGGIAIRRDMDPLLQQKVNQLIKESVQYAFTQPESPMNYVKQHAQEMSEEVMKKHIALYVNDFSVELGLTGKNAVELLFAKAAELNLFPYGGQQLIIE
ncbi:MAG: 1,4-dihydroxy-6-naphthoate synthase [Bacteroidia bacterium]|nr:1,4-dihydroxy-6-naphthoate synthase [Bacteroidia bacterium]